VVPVHRLRPNHSEWTPGHVAYLDTETRRADVARGELHRLRLWCARLDDRRATASRPAGSSWADGDTAAQLAEQITSWTVGRSTIWVYCHNLAFDAATTRLPTMLGRAGWQVSDCAVSGGSPWIRMRRGSKRLAFCDSWSWLPASLATIGEAVGAPKPPLPADDDDRAAWLARCAADVDTLAVAVGSLLDWWDRQQLGHWSITGAACGWNAYRHKPTTQHVVIDPDPGQVEADRETVYGGRRGVGRVGEQRYGPFAEIDFKAAYNTVAAWCPLPWKRSHPVESMGLDDPRLHSDRLGYAGRVQLATVTARWPMRWRGLVWYPVGRFTTHLTQPDLAEAQRLGALVAVGPGWVHRLSDQMAGWAAWNLDVQDGREPDSPPAARMAAKAWGRSVIGKWSAHGHDRTRLGPSVGDGWGYQDGWTLGTRARGGLLTLAGDTFWTEATTAGDNTYPAVHAFVEAEVRVRIGRVIDALGPRAVLQCDTDGLIVNARRAGTKAARGHLTAPATLGPMGRLHWCLDQLEPVYSPLTLRIKRTFTHVEIHGPQHMRVANERRYSGVPREAKQTGPNTFSGLAWPKLAWQMGHNSGAGYLRPVMDVTVDGPYAPGWVLSDNTVVPVAVDLDDAGDNQVLTWDKTARLYPGARLADRQNPHLAGLW